MKITYWNVFCQADILCSVFVYFHSLKNQFQMSVWMREEKCPLCYLEIWM